MAGELAGATVCNNLHVIRIKHINVCTRLELLEVLNKTAVMYALIFISLGFFLITAIIKIIFYIWAAVCSSTRELKPQPQIPPNVIYTCHLSIVGLCI